MIEGPLPEAFVEAWGRHDGLRGQVIYADFQELATPRVVEGSLTDFVSRFLES